jgi:hypothetical protein
MLLLEKQTTEKKKKFSLLLGLSKERGKKKIENNYPPLSWLVALKTK